MEFHKNVKIITIRGFKMIANFDNGSLIGINEEGAILVQKILDKSMVQEKKLTESQKALYKALIEQKYFVKKDETDESVEAAYLHLTQKCNLHCLGCYSLDSLRNNVQDMTFEQVCVIIEKLKKWGIKSLIISGGEPFVRKDIYEILRYIKEDADIPFVQIITNGTMEKNYNLEMLKKYVDVVNVSIDGYSREMPTYIRDVGIFDKVINSVIQFRKNDIKTNIVVTIHRKNIDKFNQYVELAQKLDVSVNFSLLTCAGDFKGFDEWIPTEQQMISYGKKGFCGIGEKYGVTDPTAFIVTARKSCGVGNGLISIGYDGTIYPCHMLHNKEMKMGNILHMDEKQKESFLRYKEKIRENVSVENNEECKACEFAYVCGGGCRSRALTDLNGMIKRDSYCQLNYAYFDMVFEKLKAYFAG